MQETAFVFPGQGSQSVGMLENIALQHPIIPETFKEASQVLGYDLWALSTQGPAEKLNQTEYTQPALLTAGVAMWRLARALRAHTPIAFLAGHSLGEYTALVCSEALELTDAIRLVALRGRLMQEAVQEGEGAMAAILGLENDAVRAICEEATTTTEIVAPANYNTIGQVVISGHKPAVLRAMERAKAAGAKRALPLPVSVPAHCVLMKPAAVRLQEALAEIPFKLPRIPVIHNVDVSVHESIDEIRQVLVEQLCEPVRWVETIQLMALKGVKTIYECGPGAVLSGLNKRIDATLAVESLSLFLSKSNGEALCP
ncbi:MAG TPA: ACP S-malonyltransferase [Gammaproteobacteria bacterium]|nr:ACP S-malonyltransferase [Gammaproteobacteria bacterium]